MAMRLLPVFATVGVVSAKMSLLAKKDRPISKVITMLTDMKNQLQVEATDDQEVYEKLTCWCKDNREEKKLAIAQATAKISELKNTIEVQNSKYLNNKAKAEAQFKANSKNKAALEEASGLRMKESTEFQETSKDQLQTIAACKSAIVTLSKHNPELAQLKSVARVLSRKLSSHSAVSEKSTIEGMLALKGFLNNVEQAKSFLQIPGYQSHASQSGQVYGMLKQMKETMEANLSDAEKEENQKIADFKQLRAAKTAEIKAGEQQHADYRQKFAAAKSSRTDAEKDLENTQEQLSNDTEFLADLEKKCAQTDADFARRTKSRNEEIEAVADTIKILNEDTSFDAFNRSGAHNPEDATVVPEFVQVAERATMMSEQKRNEVVSLLSTSNDPKMMLIATYAKLNAFTKVKAEIEKLVQALAEEQKAEVEQRDTCNDNFHANRMETEKTDDEKTKLTNEIAVLAGEIEQLDAELKAAKAAIAEATKNAKRAGDDRASENAEFQRELSDQRITQAILEKAKERMMQKYDTNEVGFLQKAGGNHIQTSATKTDAGNGPAAFNTSGTGQEKNGWGVNVNAGGSKVIALLNNVINDSRSQEKVLRDNEVNAQTAYESFIKDSSRDIDTRQKEVVMKTQERASKKEEKAEKETEKNAKQEALEGLAEEKAIFHDQCDFLLKNFNDRQDARSTEMAALKQATAILSGAQ